MPAKFHGIHFSSEGETNYFSVLNGKIFIPELQKLSRSHHITEITLHCACDLSKMWCLHPNLSKTNYQRAGMWCGTTVCNGTYNQICVASKKNSTIHNSKIFAADKYFTYVTGKYINHNIILSFSSFVIGLQHILKCRLHYTIRNKL